MTGARWFGTGTAAASVLVRDLLSGPMRPATVLAAGHGRHLSGGRRTGPGVVSAGGVRLPCAAVLAVGGRLPAAGTQLAVGGGGVYEDGRRLVAVHRWFDPRVRLVGVDGRAVARFAHVMRSRGGVDTLLPDDALDRLARGLGHSDAVGVASALLGRGTGLTPAGDDLRGGRAGRSAGTGLARRR